MFSEIRLVKMSEALLRSHFPRFKLNSSRDIRTIDRSLVPTLKEADLNQRFIKGSGPGGSNVNKRINCVQLIHKPTGLCVKVHESRLQQKNKKIARERLINLLDNHYNGEKSIDNQIKKKSEEKMTKKISKQKKLNEMKAKWKEIISEYRKMD